MTYSCPDFVDDVLEALGVEVPEASSDSPADQADLAIAAIRRLQAAAAMVPAIADTFRDVCETHVYDTSNGDKHPADCPLCKAIADADALAPAIDTPRPTITITIQGGCLTDVDNLPPGWDYELIDLDNENDRADA